MGSIMGTMLTNEEYTRIFLQYKNEIYRYCLVLLLRDISSAEDVMMEVFLRLPKYYEKIKDEDHLKYWLLRCARSRCKDHYRRAHRRREIQIVWIDDVTDSDEVLDRQDRSQARSCLTYDIDRIVLREELLYALLQIPYKYREVIVLRYYHDLSNKEIADLLNISEPAIRTRYSRAMDMLKEYYPTKRK